MSNSSVRWQDRYRTALLELDSTKLLSAIEQAEESIRERQQEIEQMVGRSHDLERQQLSDALGALALLRRDPLLR